MTSQCRSRVPSESELPPLTQIGLDDASLERAVRESEALARISPENPQYLPELGPQTFTVMWTATTKAPAT